MAREDVHARGLVHSGAARARQRGENFVGAVSAAVGRLLPAKSCRRRIPPPLADSTARGTSVTSSVIRSIETRPAMGARVPAMARVSAIADGAHETVRIPQSHGGEHRGPLRPEAWLRNQRSPPCQRGGVGARGPSGRRRRRTDLCAAFCAIAAIETDAGTHQIEGVVLAEQHAAGRREARGRRRQHGERGAETVELDARSSSRSDRRRRRDGSSAGRARMPSRRFFAFAAPARESSSPGRPSRFMPVSMWIAASSAVLRLARGGRPAGDFGQRIQHRGETMADQRRRRYRRAAPSSTKMRAFGTMGRSAMPSSSRATKNVSQPATASARAIRARRGRSRRP